MKTTLDAERTRLQANIRDMEREITQLQQQLRFTQDELQKSHSMNSTAQNEEKELQGRLANEIEERERLQLQLHQVKKQVKGSLIFLEHVFSKGTFGGNAHTLDFVIQTLNTNNSISGCGPRQ